MHNLSTEEKLLNKMLLSSRLEGTHLVMKMKDGFRLFFKNGPKRGFLLGSSVFAAKATLSKQLNK